MKRLEEFKARKGVEPEFPGEPEEAPRRAQKRSITGENVASSSGGGGGGVKTGRGSTSGKKRSSSSGDIEERGGRGGWGEATAKVGTEMGGGRENKVLSTSFFRDFLTE